MNTGADLFEIAKKVPSCVAVCFMPPSGFFFRNAATLPDLNTEPESIITDREDGQKLQKVAPQTGIIL